MRYPGLPFHCEKCQNLIYSFCYLVVVSCFDWLLVVSIYYLTITAQMFDFPCFTSELGFCFLDPKQKLMHYCLQIQIKLKLIIWIGLLQIYQYVKKFNCTFYHNLKTFIKIQQAKVFDHYFIKASLFSWFNFFQSLFLWIEFFIGENNNTIALLFTQVTNFQILVYLDNKSLDNSFNFENFIVLANDYHDLRIALNLYSSFFLFSPDCDLLKNKFYLFWFSRQ